MQRHTHTVTFPYTSHTHSSLRLEADAPDCVRYKYSYEEKRSLAPQTFMRSTTVSMKLIKTQMCLFLGMKKTSLSLSSVPQVLFQRHVPTLRK